MEGQIYRCILIFETLTLSFLIEKAGMAAVLRSYQVHEEPKLKVQNSQEFLKGR